MRAFSALLLIILVVIPVYIYVDYSTHQSGAQQRAIIGDLQLTSTTADMTGLNRNGLSLNIKAVVYNPNSFGATLDAANYSVYANGQYMGAGQTAQKYDISPQSSQTFVFPIRIGLKSAFQTMGSYIVNWGNLTWKVNGTADIEVGGFPLSVPFEFVTG